MANNLSVLAVYQGQVHPVTFRQVTEFILCIPHVQNAYGAAQVLLANPTRS